MKTKAAILVETAKPLVLDEVELPALKIGQVIVEVAYSGICRTQVQQVRGWRGKDPFLPHLLGHEGTGIVREVGPGVKKAKVGDPMILSWIKGDGIDVPGTIYNWKGKPVNSGAITTFNKFSVISENRLVPLPKGYSLKEGAHIGCTVATGLGSVFNTGKAKQGQSVLVYGAGGVGLCAVAAAAIQGCKPVIAVDVNPEKLKQASMMGATHTIRVNGGETTQEIMQICPKGVDIAVEASGTPAAMEQGIKIIRSQGGAVVIIGNAKDGLTITYDPKDFNQGKSVLGTWGGDNWPDRDFPRYLEMAKSGRLRMDLFSTKVYSLDQINQAVDDLDSGKVVRPLIDMSLT